VLGDIISFGSNAGRIFRRWHYKSGDRVSDRLRPLSIDLSNHGFDIYKWTGEFVINQPSPKADPEAPVFNGHRGELHSVVFEYARNELRIPIHLGKRIQKYFEDDKQAGIVLEDGEKVSVS
jgi:2-polyprenyl-6-methoxyphenol hydroxylase-like FAD-dependent oxidoreductase